MRRINEKGKQPFELSQLQYYEGLMTHLFYDLGHYVELSCGDPALVEEFTSATRPGISPRKPSVHDSRFYSQYNNGSNPVHFYTGVSVSEPSTKYVAENRMTNWYRDTH